MKALWYVDLTVAQDSARGPSGASIDTMALMLRIVHAHAKEASFPFATALPGMRTGTHAHPGGVLRLFAEERDHCDELAGAVEVNPHVSGAAIVSRVRPVPQGYGKSASYCRFRIASRKSAERVDGISRRVKRLAFGDALPYLKLRSASTGQSFSLRINVRKANEPASEECSPDGYGLASATRSFSVPDLPLAVAPWKRIGSKAEAEVA